MSEKAKWKKRVDVAMQEDGSQWLPVSDAGKDLRKRSGRFHFAVDSECWNEVMMVLSQVFVTWCEHKFVDNTFEYAGFSEHFRTVREGEIIPEYIILLHRENDRIAWFEFQEQ